MEKSSLSHGNINTSGISFEEFIMKTKKELNSLKEDTEAFNNKLNELTEGAI